MYLNNGIKKESLVREIVNQYGIEFCCGAKWSLETICMMKGIDFDELREKLEQAGRNIHLSGFTSFNDWDVDFLIDYIINIHHNYLRKMIPGLWPVLNKFVDEHLKKDEKLFIVQSNFRKLQKDMLPHLLEEENDVFPYIRQLAHAYKDKDPYAVLLVKTMRRPIAAMMGNEHETVKDILGALREHTNNYTPPEKACTSHRVVFSKLKELDDDLSHHMYLENKVLFPKALTMEQELLNGKV